MMNRLTAKAVFIDRGSGLVKPRCLMSGSGKIASKSSYPQ